MIANEKAPTCWRRVGAQKQNVGKHPVPIVTHAAHGRKYVRGNRKIKLVWTPVNIALLLLLAAAAMYLTVKLVCADPLYKSDLMISMANSVFRV